MGEVLMVSEVREGMLTTSNTAVRTDSVGLTDSLGFTGSFGA